MQLLIDNNIIKNTIFSRNSSSNNKIYFLSFLFILLTYIVYASDILRGVIRVWGYSGSYNFSYIVCLIAITWLSFNLYYSYKKKDTVFSPSVFSLLGVLLCVVFGFIAYILQLTALAQIFVLLMLWFIIYACFGYQQAKINTKPFVLLLCTIPIVTVLESQVVFVIKGIIFDLLNLMGVTVNYKNKFIEAQNLVIYVNRTYTGLRYTNVIFIVSFLYSCMYIQRSTYRILFIISSLLSAQILNIIRVCMHINYANTYGIDNYKSNLLTHGWIWFFIILLVVFVLAKFYEHVDRLKSRKYKYLNIGANDLSVSSITRLVFNLIAIVLLLIGFSYFRGMYREVVHSIPSFNVIKNPRVTHGWKLCSECMINDWCPMVGNPSVKLINTYSNIYNQKLVDFYIGYYEHQYVGNSLVGLNNKFDFSNSWTVSKTDIKKLNIRTHIYKHSFEKIKNQKVKVNRIFLYNDKTKEKRVLWYWFWVSGANTNNPVYAKYLEFWDILSSFRTHSALVAVSSTFIDRQDLISVEDIMNVFVVENYNNLAPETKRTAVVL